MTHAGFCENCFKGATLDGTPKGSMEKIGPWDTYIAHPPSGPSSCAIIFFTDIFGLKLINNKLIPDMLAESVGVTVYVPDIFTGEAISPEKLIIPETAEEVRAQNIFSKIMFIVKMITLIPYLFRHWPTKKINDAEKFIEVLKSQKNLTRFGTVGYCYGGPLATKFNCNGKACCTVLCHPSNVSMRDIRMMTNPVSFACAEIDQAFDDELQTEAEAYFKKEKPDIDFELIKYKGTAHGFAARPNMALPAIKAGFEGALNQTSAFFQKYILAD